MNKLVAAIIAILLIINISPVAIKATGKSGFEIYDIIIQNGASGNRKCTIDGSFFGEAESAVEMKAAKQGDSSASAAGYQTVSDSDGSFYFEFEYDLEAYSINIAAENGEKAEFELDFSGLEGLFAENPNYIISSLTYTAEKISLSGYGMDIANKAVTLQITDGAEIKDVNISSADDEGRFRFDFSIEPGKYILCLNSEMAKYARYEFTTDISCSMLSVSENDGYKFIKKLEECTNELELLKNQCDEKGLSTDYENAYIQIIKKFTEYAKDEIENNDLSRLGKYDYTLTRLYDETKAKLESYLRGEGNGYNVPKYVTSDLRLDGKSVIAKTDINGKTEERPVFFVGYGHFETAEQEIPFFSEVGFNTAQYTSLYVEYILRGMTVPGWGEYVSRGSNATFEVSDEASVSGKNSVKIMHPDEEEYNHFKRLSQPVKVKPNTTYEFGLKAKATDISRKGAVWFRFDMDAGYGRADQYFTENRRYIENSDGWKDYSFEYTTGSDETILPFAIGIESKVGSVYIDDIYVREKGKEENLLFNGSMEDEIDYNSLSSIEKEAYDLGLIIDYTDLNKFEDFLVQAERENILVDVGCITHALSTYIMQTYPEMSTPIDGNVTKFDIKNEAAKKIISIYVRLITEIMSRHESAKSFCMMGEPTIKANKTTVYDEAWVEYLTEKYGTASKLNDEWGTSYKNLSEIKMPKSNDKTAVYNEYLRFNESLVTEINSYIAEVARSVDDDILIHSKVMDYFHSGYSPHLEVGENYEELCKLMDVNGCDAFSYYDREGYPLSLKMAWYDFQTSLLDAPVWDTESHVIKDSTEMNYSPEIPYYTGADVWNGAVHGRGNQVLWLWDRSNKGVPWKGGSKINPNAALRPDDVVEVVKATLDLNRLAREVSAIQKEEAKVGLLYSITSSGYSTDYMEKLRSAYEQIIFSGQKVGFVTDSRPEDMNKFDVLVIPGAVNNVPYGVVSEIKEYMEKGGNVILMEDDVLMFNEHNKLHDQSLINYIHNNGLKEENISGKIAELIPSSVVLRDADTGNRLSEGTEWSYAQCDGRYVINVLNYENDTKNIKIEINGEEVNEIKELRSGEISGSLKAEQYKPLLAAVDIFEIDMIDDSGKVLEENISSIKQGKIKCESKINGDIILALYRNDVLVKASIGTGVIEVPRLEEEKYRLMISAWDMNTLRPITQSVVIQQEGGS